MKVSIIVTCFNNTKISKHMSMVCLDHIRKFTPADKYELIVVDPIPKYGITDGYKTLDLEGENSKHIVLDYDPGYTASMNLGAREAKGEILVFIQNDVFVREHWLDDLLFYINDGYECVFPDQVPRSREYVLATYGRDHADPESKKGGRDAGLMMITRDAFNRVGGWNEELSLLAEKDFYERMGQAGVKWTDTNKVLITHIMAGTNIQLLVDDPEEYNRKMDADALKINK